MKLTNSTANDIEGLRLLGGECEETIKTKTRRKPFPWLQPTICLVFGALGFAIGQITPTSNVFVGEMESACTRVPLCYLG